MPINTTPFPGYPTHASVARPHRASQRDTTKGAAIQALFIVDQKGSACVAFWDGSIYCYYQVPGTAWLQVVAAGDTNGTVFNKVMRDAPGLAWQKNVDITAAGATVSIFWESGWPGGNGGIDRGTFDKTQRGYSGSGARYLAANGIIVPVNPNLASL